MGGISTSGIGHVIPEQLAWVSGALALACFGPTTKLLANQFKPNWVHTTAIALLFITSIYHFGKTTEFLYYQF
jgi:hypothetical protein